MFHFFPFQQSDKCLFDLGNPTKLLPAIPEIHALHKARHIADDADNAVLIAVVHADRILTIRPTKIYSKQLRLGSEVGDASV